MKQSANKKNDPAAFGRELAEKYMLDKRAGFKRLAAACRRWLLFVRAVFVRSSKLMEHKTLPEPFEWLCDNYYIIEQAAKSAIRDCTKIKRIPAVQYSGRRLPFIFAAAAELVKSEGYILSGRSLVRFLSGLQSRRSLELGEIQAFPCAVRLALVDVAASVCAELNNMLNAAKDKTEQILTPERSRELAKTMSDVINGIKLIDQLDFDKLLSGVSHVEKLLCKDPAGVYGRMQQVSKAHYRERVTKIAKKKGIRETEVAENAVKAAEGAQSPRERHVGYWLFADADKDRRAARLSYIFLLALMPLAIAFIAAVSMPWWAAVVVYFPIFEAVKALLDYLFTRFTKPCLMPRLDLSKGIPDEGRTLAVISALITDGKKAEHFIERIERFYYANPDNNLKIGILADLPDADKEVLDADAEIIDRLSEGVERLNKSIGEHFAAFIRTRSYNETQKKYMAWERKRGALLELANFLAGAKNGIRVLGGNIENLHGCKYLITIDADTELLMDTARELISTMMHPLCKGEIIDGRVRKGYGILTPCIETDIEAASRSVFARLTSGLGGVDSYGGAVADLYQDIFGEGIFTGKGIIDLDLFREMHDALPENRILSHDILEGGFLRAGFVSDVKLTDGYPAAASSYIDRLHRWIRGDWQNAAWILPHVKNAKGETVKNPLSGLTRFKLIDNLRRPMTPVFTVAALISAACIPYGGLLAGILSVLWLIMPVLISLVEGIISGGLSQIFCVYYSKSLGGVKGAAATALMWTLLLPYLARTAIDASIRSIWRVLVSKENLLAWVTADQSEMKNKNSFAAYLKRMWPDVALGIALILLPLAWPVKIFAAAWVLSPAVAWYTAKPVKKELMKVSEDEKRLVTSFCQDMWKFFEENMTEETLYLPPDNIQEKPVYRVAMRTSPTNIGLGLLCCLAARDFGFITSEQLYNKLKNSFDTIARLEKWRGHLLNWYSLEDGQPLLPKYVSSVDSGNFAACLITLKAGLRQYADEYPKLQKLADRIQEYLDNIDWRILYCRRRNLFHIGYNVTAGKKEGIYDLLMSESRIASFLTIATRAVPKKHWSSISRPLIRRRNRIGLVSWTGTMFEYFMPHLFMPIFRPSAGFEAVRFALGEQIERGRRKKIPWGVSESGYYAFDPLYNYQYKAFGVQTLGFKRGLDDEIVVSPYSSFLAMTLAPRKALENLRRIYNLGFYGKYGFYEAIDYTPERVGKGFGLVRSFMAHHVGMSMVAAANLCMDNVMQRRFMSNPEMMAAAELLKERVPSGAVIHENRVLKQPPMRLSKEAFYSAKVQIEKPNPLKPKGFVLSNGEMSLVFSDSGIGYIKCGDIHLTQFKNTEIEHPQGIFAVAKDDRGAVSATALPLNGDGAKHEFLFESGKMTFTGTSDSLKARQAMTVDCDMLGGIFKFTVQNIESRPKETRLFVYLEPCILRLDDSLAHPAFYNLFIESFYDSQNAAILFKRRPRNPSDVERWLCIAFSRRDFSFETRRDMALTRMKGVSSLFEMGSARLEGFTGACIDPAMLVCFPFYLQSKGSVSVEMGISEGNSKDEAIAAARKLLAQGFNRVAVGFTKGHDVVRSYMGFGAAEEKIMNQILSAVGFGADDWAKQIDFDALKKGKSALWRYGISGDIPIVLIRVSKPENLFKITAFIKAHKYLSFCGVEYDCVIVYDEIEGYLSTVADALSQIIRLCSASGMLKRKGGIFPIDSSLLVDGYMELLTSVACYYWDDGGDIESAPEGRAKEEGDGQNVSLVPPKIVTQGPAKLEFQDDGESVEISGMPNLPWSFIMTNSYFGSLVSDKSLGYTWAFNARENKLTPWDNDIVADNRGERLILNVNGSEYDVCASSEKTVYDEASALYTANLGGIRVSARCFVDSKLPLKFIVADLTSDKETSAAISYKIVPLLGVSRAVRKYVQLEKHGDMTLFTNNYAGNFTGQCGFIWCSANDLESGQNGIFREPQWIGKTKKVMLKQGKAARVVFVLGYARSQKMLDFIAKRLPKIDVDEAYSEVVESTRKLIGRVQIKTPDENLNRLFNRWLPLQAIKCRLIARTGFYQCGGAYGFRDQLQDSMAAFLYNPRFLKCQIIRACAHQFIEGDVQHWWHPIRLDPDKGHRGIRTRCSDDLLWLPYALCRYVDRTGDQSLLDIEIEYIQSETLGPNERERYEVPLKSGVRESVYSHAVRAIDKSFTLGPNGLPLFGSGDWNDGMNLVGEKGKGESVWLAMFMVVIFEDFARLAKTRGDVETAEKCSERANRLKKAIESAAWDGQWYKRGFFDDGKPLGSKLSEECRIDSIAQSFAAFSKCDGDRVSSALKEAYAQLVDKEIRVIKLFTPPFDVSEENPGYIKGYLPGVRENGGQYTHAAIWLAMAMLERGEIEKGYEILSMINPMNRLSDEQAMESYRAEPYVIAADVYTAPSQQGRAGWTWYTGSAGWYIRVIIESLLGLKLLGGQLDITPKIPKNWSGFEADITINDAKVHIRAKRKGQGNNIRVFLDGKETKPPVKIPDEGKIGLNVEII